EDVRRGLGWKNVDGVVGKIVPQVRRNRHDLIARHHQRLAGLGTMRTALLQHLGEARPFLRALVLTAKLALAITPATVRDDGRHALVDAAGVDRDRAAKARADDRDALGIDSRMACEE